MSARRIVALAITWGALGAGASSCSSTPGLVCDGASGTCLGLTITSSHVTSLDTLAISASGAFSGTRQSSIGRAAPLPIRLRISYPTAAAGVVTLDVTGLRGGAVVARGTGSASIMPGQHSSLAVDLEPSTVAGGDMATPGDLAGDLSSLPGSDMKPGADMARKTLAFTPKGPFNCGPNAIDVALGNFQGKGKVDIVVANHNGGSAGTGVSLLLQAANGSYPSSPTLFADGMDPAGVGVGPFFTGSGKDDFAFSDGRYYLYVADNNRASPPVFTATQFTSAGMLGNGTGAVAVGDLNGDSAADMVLTVNADNSAKPAIVVLIGDGAGGVKATAPAPAYYEFSESPSRLAVGDLTGTGKLDIVASMATNLYVLHNNGSGVFTVDQMADKHAVGVTPQFVAIADFDGNHKNDIAVANNGGGVSILLNDGSGGFPATASAVPAGGQPNGIAAADFDGDGKVDLAVTNQSGTTVSVLLGDGQGGFGAPVAFTVGNGPSALAASDLNADLKPDLVVVNQPDQTVTVLMNSSF